MSCIILTIDIEDWFQVENLRPYCPPSTWDNYELRVERSSHRLLDLLDSVQLSCPHTTSSSSPLSPQTETIKTPTEPKATFFVLGWIAERLPGLVREIGHRGHEIASHGYSHNLCSTMGRCELRADLVQSKNKLEDIAGVQVQGYRAPGFSADDSVLELVLEAGYSYDSSLNSLDLNPRCGHIDLSRSSCSGNAWVMPSGLLELPVSNLSLGPWTIPWGGGGYFRLYPQSVYTAGVKRIFRQKRDFVFYMHPWEVDPDQPRIKGPGLVARFRHYHNLDSTLRKLHSFLTSMQNFRITSCLDYLGRLPADQYNPISLSGIDKCLVQHPDL